MLLDAATKRLRLAASLAETLIPEQAGQSCIVRTGLIGRESEFDSLVEWREKLEKTLALTSAAVDRHDGVTGCFPTFILDAIGAQPATGLLAYSRDNAVRTGLGPGAGLALAHVENTVRLGFDSDRMIWGSIANSSGSEGHIRRRAVAPLWIRRTSFQGAR